MSDEVTNYFVHRSAAKRYAAARPFFHPQVMEKIVAFTNAPCSGNALDIACGTGQSARALAGIAETVEAIDISAEMIAEAEPHDRVRYQVASAEQMPFAQASFDLATVGLAFHWFDQAMFLAEARRVLKPGGWLMVYTSGFSGEMIGNADFRQWAWEIYPKRFPMPARRSIGMSAELVGPFGFLLLAHENFSHDEMMTGEQLTSYLLTQTNVIAAVESGSMPIEDAAEWIADGVMPFFAGKECAMKFSGSIWYVRRS